MRFLNLVLGVLCKIVKSGDVEPEFRSLGEFAKACAQAHKSFFLHVSCPSHDRITDIKNSILVQTEAVFLIRPFYEVLDISPDTALRFKKLQKIYIHTKLILENIQFYRALIKLVLDFPFL